MTITGCSNVTPQQYLAALIEIYRGYSTPTPTIDSALEAELLKDVLSSAMRFAENGQVVQGLSEELFACAKGECSFNQQVELAQKQTPDILNAKMTAAAYVMRVLNSQN